MSENVNDIGIARVITQLMGHSAQARSTTEALLRKDQTPPLSLPIALNDNSYESDDDDEEEEEEDDDKTDDEQLDVSGDDDVGDAVACKAFIKNKSDGIVRRLHAMAIGLNKDSGEALVNLEEDPRVGSCNLISVVEVYIIFVPETFFLKIFLKSLVVPVGDFNLLLCLVLHFLFLDC